MITVQRDINIAIEHMQSHKVIPDCGTLLFDLYQRGSHHEWTFYARIYSIGTSVMCVYCRTYVEWPYQGLWSLYESFDFASQPKIPNMGYGSIICGVKQINSHSFLQGFHAIKDSLLSIPRSSYQRRDGIVLDGIFHLLRIYEGSAVSSEFQWDDKLESNQYLTKEAITFLAKTISFIAES